MGTTTHLFHGFNLWKSSSQCHVFGAAPIFNDDTSPLWLVEGGEVSDTMDDWDDEWAKRAGIHEEAPGEGIDPRNREWRNRCFDARKARGVSANYASDRDASGFQIYHGIDIGYYGTHEGDGGLVYYAAAKVFDITYDTGRSLSKDDMTVSEDQIEKFKVFCELMQIPWREPEWIMAHYWCP